MTETPERRSAVMRAVKSRDTAPEMAVRRLVHSMGYRYRLHRKDLPGKPDLVFPSRKKAIFVHGCFWHGHTCPRGDRLPKTNAAYWTNKIARNRQRYESQRAELCSDGWRVLTVWECETRARDTLAAHIRAFLNDDGGVAACRYPVGRK